MDIRPDFYDKFYCLAHQCRHTCCQVWEIDVDDVTLAKYRAEPGPLGEDLRAAMTRSPDGSWSIRLNDGGFCPFLREDGLCRLIVERGEDFLCDICALHPRFFEDVGEHELSGVGLCCEHATALLLEGEGPLLFLTEEDEPLALEELLSRLGLAAPPGSLVYSPTVDAAYYETIFRRYGACEAIDDAWTYDLAGLAADPVGCAEGAKVYISQNNLSPYQRIFDYILYRQLELAGEYGLPALIRYAGESTDFILLWTARTGDLPDCLRRWSEEMEYSTENVGLLLDPNFPREVEP